VGRSKPRQEVQGRGDFCLEYPFGAEHLQRKLQNVRKGAIKGLKGWCGVALETRCPNCRYLQGVLKGGVAIWQHSTYLKRTGNFNTDAAPGTWTSHRQSFSRKPLTGSAGLQKAGIAPPASPRGLWVPPKLTAVCSARYFALPLTLLGLEQHVPKKPWVQLTLTLLQPDELIATEGESYASLSPRSQPSQPHRLVPAAGSGSGLEPGRDVCPSSVAAGGGSTLERRGTRSSLPGGSLRSLPRKRRFSGCFSSTEERSWRLHYHFRSKFSNSGVQSPGTHLKSRIRAENVFLKVQVLQCIC